MARAISFEYLNRQLVWHELSELLLFVLPLISVTRLKRMIVTQWPSLRATTGKSKWLFCLCVWQRKRTHTSSEQQCFHKTINFPLIASSWSTICTALGKQCRQVAITDIILGYVQPNTYSAHQDCRVSQLMFLISSFQTRVQSVALMTLLCPSTLCLAIIASVTIACGQIVRQTPNFPVRHAQSELEPCADGRHQHSSQASHCGIRVSSNTM